MFLLKLLLFILGLALIVFGSLIYFKKKYNLINNFEEDLKVRRFDENYAKRIGLIELIAGIIFFIFFLITMIIPKWILSLFLVGFISLIVALMINHLKSKSN